MAGRFPGADDIARFWELLAAGGDAITTDDRQPRPGGFLRNVTGMDGGFFAVSAAEAAAMDPQQRLLLELAWEALEDSRTSPAAKRGGSVGVYIGGMHGDYENLANAAPPTRHTLTGLNRGMLANRISYFLGLRGPSLTVDAGQASSLVAVHLAVQAIRHGECDEALAGGVNLALSDRETGIAEQFGALSPDHTCFTFDERANGYVRGEGGALVALKPLAAAVAAGDRIYAVVHGSAVNNDGANSDSLTTPSADAQADVLRAALDDASLGPEQIDYVELHGTGTPVGDPVEAAALGRVYGTTPHRRGALRVGSVKTNIGHLEGAAGIAGLVKAALAIRHSEIPPTRNFRSPNPRIPLGDLGLEMVLTRTPWRAAGTIAAGVSSFGMGGVNCHLVLCAPPDAGAPDPRPPRRGDDPTPLVLSAATPGALRARAGQLRDALTASTDLDDLAYSLHTTRARHDHRAVIVGRDRGELLSGLEAAAAGAPTAQVVAGAVARTEHGAAGRIAFVFPGQGAQRPGMARALYRTSPAFAARLDAVVEHFAPHLDIDLLDLLTGESDTAALLDRTQYTQPALFAVELALFEFAGEFGVAADYLIGHSIGELVAATASGAFEVAEAARLVAERGRLMQSAPRGGAMVAIAAAETELREYRETVGADFDIAAVNHRRATVISGDAATVTVVGAAFAARGHRTTELAVSHAFHSAYMDSAAAAFHDVVSATTVGPLAIPVVSNVTGRLLTGSELADPGYLARQLRQTVRFGAGVETLLDHEVTCFVELGPGSGLSSAIRAAPGVDGRSIAAIPALRAGIAGAAEFVRVLAEIECAGAGVGWEKLSGSRRRIDLPTYPFQRTAHWLDPAAGREVSATAVPPHGAEPDPSVSAAIEPAAAVGAALARVLGTTSPTDDELRRDFKSLGMDSLGAVQFRDTVAELSGLTLPASLVYDHPTPRAVIAHLAELRGAEEQPVPWTGARAPSGPGPADTGQGPVRPESGDDEVVIVSTAGRWPGGLDTPEELWAALAEGRELVGELPTDREWDLAALRDTGAGGALGTQRGGFLYDAAEFDAAFFGVGPREAQSMDPQQRLLLESTWTCLQRAGLAPSALRGSVTGVYIGAVQQEYGPRMHEAESAAAGYLLTGTTNSVISGRLAYHFGFAGPAVTIDTACSSSLVALHLAVRALRDRECDLAVVGGVCVMAAPGMFTEFGRQGGLAGDGRCKPFADDADGTVWAEAVATLLVERRADAVRAGHRILAVVRGTAINSDGASNGLTAPSGTAQQRVITAALADARITADAVDVVEAHGTGTALGDPIEAEALAATYGRAHGPQRPVLVGSVKSNIGHTQAAAGVTGVIKLVGALRSGTVPPTINVGSPSRLVDWDRAHLDVPAAGPVPWPRTGGPRIAAISSFGISGTNAHAILQEPGEPVGSWRTDESGNEESVRVRGQGSAADELPVPLVFSARSAQSLRAHAAALRTAAAARVPAGLLAVADELCRVDEGFAYRAVVRPDPDGILEALHAVAAGSPSAGAFVAGPPDRVRPRAFVFSGQGSQRVGMGVSLAGSVPAFATALAEVIDHLDRYLPQPLGPVLSGAAGADLVHRTRYTQPAVFAFEVAMFRWLESLGLRPDFVAGHSIGELAAAHVAAVLDLDDACRLVAARGRLMDEIAEPGAMAALEATEAEVLGSLAEYAGVDIAAVNAPRAIVISGDRAAVEAVADEYRSAGRKARLLTVSHAFHSPHMDAITDEFARVADSVRIESPRIALVSSLTGRIVDSAAELGSDYWVRHARRTVRFADAVRTLHDAGVRTYLEVGPDAVLLPMITQSVPDSAAEPPVVLAATATRRGAEPVTAARALEALYLDGADLRWRDLARTRPAETTPLPTYAFSRTRYWSSPRPSDRNHPVLATVVRSVDDAVLLTGVVSLRSAPWLADHVVGSAAIFPGTGFLDLALYAAAVAGDEEVEQLDLTVPMPLAESDRVVEVVVAAPEHRGPGATRHLSIRSRTADSDWVTHATGQLTRSGSACARAQAQGELLVPQRSTAELYDDLAADGYRYGPAFRNLRQWAVAESGRLRAVVELDRTVPADSGYRVHPALLDAVLHPFVAAVLNAGSGTVVPAQFRGVRVRSQPRGPVTAYLARTDRYSAGIRLAAADGDPIVEIDEVTLLPATLPTGPDDGVPGRLIRRPAGPVAAVARGEVAVIAAGGGAGGFTGPAALRDAVRDGRPVPAVVLAVPEPSASDIDDVAAATHRVVAEHITLLQDWVNDDLWADSQLAVVIDGTDCSPGALSRQALAGLVRSAQHEWPGRFRLVDTDAPAEVGQLAAAVETIADPEVVLRSGRVHEAAVEPLRPADSSGGNGRDADPFDGTVLVTGASGALARIVCRHLVTAHRARRLLLVSRTPVRAELIGELERLGAEVTTAACDIAEPGRIGQLLAGIDPATPLTAIFHLAGVLDDAALTTIEPGQLAATLRPKVDGAWNLHEQTLHCRELRAFVLFSSMVATTGNPGQSCYGAANSFLDGLARLRHSLGLPATSIGWGLWEAAEGMGSALTNTERARLRRSGVGSLTAEQATRYLDIALAAGAQHVLATSAWRTAAVTPAGRWPATASRPADIDTAPVDPLDSADQGVLPPGPRKDIAAALVRDAVARALGFASGADLDLRRGFLDMGVDSLAAVELRNEISRACGLRLPATVLIDYPTVEQLGEHLAELLERGESSPVPKASGADFDLAGLLAQLERANRESTIADGAARDQLLTQLRELTSKVDRARRTDELDLTPATDDEIFDLIDNQLGLSRDEA